MCICLLPIWPPTTAIHTFMLFYYYAFFIISLFYSTTLTRMASTCTY